MSDIPPNPPLSIPRDRLLEFATQAQWYHTIELYPGLRTSGTYDHSPYLHHYGFPQSLSGWTVLDVGTGDGYFSFEFERRAASMVVTTDTNTFDGSVPIDVSPAHRDEYLAKYRSHYQANIKFSDIYNALGVPYCHQFLAARAVLRSRVECRTLSVYELSSLNQCCPNYRKFDLVFCGDLIEHLKSPLVAIENLAAVTGGKCIIALSSVLSDLFSWHSANHTSLRLRLKLRHILRKKLGIPAVDAQRTLRYLGNDSGGSFFHFYPETFRQALLASGFGKVEIYSQFDLPNRKHRISNLHVVYHCSP